MAPPALPSSAQLWPRTKSVSVPLTTAFILPSLLPPLRLWSVVGPPEVARS